jgi:hypothetical protein
MAITPSNLIEAIVDDLAMGELGQQAETFASPELTLGRCYSISAPWEVSADRDD